MDHGEYKKMYDLENTYWWYVGRRAIIQIFLKQFIKSAVSVIYDIGCGTGINLSILSKFGSQVKGFDTSSEALSYCRDRGFSNVELIEEPYKINAPTSSADLVSMLDVLEHLDDPERMLREVVRLLKGDGQLVMTVPAYQFLWSEHDIALHHKRRYTVSGLRKVLEASGFSIERISYCISFSFPIIVGYRILKGIINLISSSTPKTSHVQLPGMINSFFIYLLSLEAKLLRYLNFPFGTSIIVVAKKEQHEK